MGEAVISFGSTAVLARRWDFDSSYLAFQPLIVEGSLDVVSADLN